MKKILITRKLIKESEDKLSMLNINLNEVKENLKKTIEDSLTPLKEKTEQALHETKTRIFSRMPCTSCFRYSYTK